MRCLIILLTFIFQGSAIASVTNPIELYGNKIEFDVIRNGKVVGQHITQFRQTDNVLRVTSKMNIDIFVLFLPVYAFDYRSTEKWVSDKLVSLDVKVDDGPDHIRFQAERINDGLKVEQEDRSYAIEGNILSTNHWNVDVLKDHRVLNTLTGNVNNIKITPRGKEKIKVSDGFINAQRYDYSGDLKDTSVWYDAQGRWVKLRFLARDGSTIDYQCRTCKGEKGQ
ncbi:MAG: hypothetical protein HWE34_13435 [Methylocystaceae bacterium]|nr:hypothetical protein [Methylocystaceae bacterium]